MSLALLPNVTLVANIQQNRGQRMRSIMAQFEPLHYLCNTWLITCAKHGTSHTYVGLASIPSFLYYGVQYRQKSKRFINNQILLQENMKEI